MAQLYNVSLEYKLILYRTTAIEFNTKRMESTAFLSSELFTKIVSQDVTESLNSLEYLSRE